MSAVALCLAMLAGAVEAAQERDVPEDAPAAEAAASGEIPPAPGDEGLDEEPPGAREPGATEPTVTLHTLVVGTPEAHTGGSAHTIRKERLQRFGADDPQAILQSVPGVYARTEDGFGLRPNVGLRGAISDRSKKITLLEDGVLFAPAPYSAPAAYYFPLIARMQAVRVLKGPAAIAQGPHTVGGAIDLVTRDVPWGQSAGLDAAAGSYAHAKLLGWAGAREGAWGFLLEGVHLRSGGFKELDGGGPTGFHRNEWMAKVRHTFDPDGSADHSVQLKVGYSDEASNETYLGLTDADFRADPLRRYAASSLDRMRWWRTQLAASHVLARGDFTLTTTAYRHDLSRTWRKVNRLGGASIAGVLAEPDSPRNRLLLAVLRGEADSVGGDDSVFVGPNQREFVSQGVQSVARLLAATGPVRHAIEVGLRLHHDSVDRLHTEDELRMRGGRPVAAGSPTITTTDDEASTDALAMHAVDAITLGRFSLTPGLRLEAFRSELRDELGGVASGGGHAVIIPGVGAYAGLTSELGVLAGVYRGFSPPAPGGGNEPELGVNWEGGLRWARRGSRAEVIGYFSDYSNLTNVCTLSTGCVDRNLDRQFNAGRAQIAGVEVFAEHRFRAGPVAFPVDVSYTFTRTRFLTSFSSADPILGRVSEGDELPYVPQHQLWASAGAELGRFGLFVGTTFVDRMREAAGSATPAQDPRAFTDELVVVDAAAHWRFLREARLYLDVRNVAAEAAIVSRRPFGARPNAPRTVILGVTFEG